MVPRILGFLVCLPLITLPVAGLAQRSGGDIQRGKVKSLDVTGKKITLTVGGKDREFQLTEDTRVLGATGRTLAERLKGISAGMEVYFKPGRRGDRDVLVGLKPAGADRSNPPAKVDLTKLKALPELGTERYQGQPGGLYPEGKNERPAAHEAAGLARAKQVQPRDAMGKPAADGKIVLLSVGMSNTSQVSQGFQRLLAGEKGINPRLLFVNGAQGGMTAAAIQDVESTRGKVYWSTVDQRLKAAGVSRDQVQAVWIKQADAGPSEGFPGYARKLQGELVRIVQILHARYPNLALVYLSGRTFGGYATTRLNPEPYAYESGFAVKWLIEQQIKGDAALNFDPKKGPVKAPWLSWGPYLWANGEAKRPGEHGYVREDFSGDGTHLSPSGQRKAGALLLAFLKSDATARTWFLAR